MSKYRALWEWIGQNGSGSFALSFDEIERIADLPLDHSFLQYKKELADYGYAVGKISVKTQTVHFIKREER